MHDTLESTGATAAQIEARFGSAVAAVVRRLTEDDGIDDRRARKSALRGQVASAGRDAALVYAADKLSKVRELRIRLTVVGDYACRPEGQQKVEHYWRSLAMLEDVLAGHPLVAQLRFELEAMRDLPPRHARREALEQAVPAGLPQTGSPVAPGAGRHSR